MNIEGLGESLIDQLLEQGLVRDFADIYALEAAQLEALVVTPREPRSEKARPRKLGKVAQPLRGALTGKATSPGIFDVLDVLGRAESLARIKDQTSVVESA